MDETFQDTILNAIVDLFKASAIAGNSVEWERVEPYAIDDAARQKRASIGIVDQGQKFGFKASVTDNQWRIAIEWFVHADADEDPQIFNNVARADVYRTMMNDMRLGGLVVQVSPVMDDVVVYRSERWAEGVMVFDIQYRTMVRDLNARM